MAAPQEQREDTLVIRRILPAPREEVFAAWTDPVGMGKWMCPGDTTRSEVELDVRVGGKFRILMKGPKQDYDHTGEYQVVEPPSKLVFTWISAGTDHQTTLVTIELLERGKKECELVLTHERLRPEAVERHRGGWGQIADRLAEFLRAGRASF